MIDTHTHLYLEHFDNDRHQAVQRAIDGGIDKMILPNIDIESIAPMLALSNTFAQNCFPCIGLHPGSVKDDAEDLLKIMEAKLKEGGFVAIGEIGVDLYWDTTYRNQQIQAFEQQIDWAKTYQLPIVVHIRNSFDEVLQILENQHDSRLSGVLHCFSGNRQQAQQALDMGFYLGIGGVLTYKKSKLPDVVKTVPVERLLLETDSPFLPPVPKRGKRNETAFMRFTAMKLAETLNMSFGEIDHITTENAINLFRLPRK